MSRRLRTVSASRAARKLAGLAGLFVCGLLLLGSLGCKQKGAAAPPVRVTRIVALAPAEWTEVGLPETGPEGASADALRAEAEHGLKRAGVKVALLGEAAERAGAAPQPGDYALHLGLRVMQVAPSPESEGRGLVRVAAVGRLSPRLRGPSLAESEAEKKAGGEAAGTEHLPPRQIDHAAVVEKTYTGAVPDAATWAAQARKAAERAGYGLGSQLVLLGEPSAKLVAQLADRGADGELRALSAELLGERRDAAALPALVAVLKDGTAGMELRDAVMGALVRIGDRKAVRPIIDAVAFADRFEMGKLLEAVAALGGDEARSYLTFVKKSHPEPTLREEAGVALQHLEQREARAQKAAAGKE